MKTFFLTSLVILLSACASKRNFPDKDVCFLLYDLKQDKYVDTFNEDRCHKRFPAVSTFKIPLAVMAFDSGVFKSEKTPVYTWNKVNTIIEAWNKDHNPTSWMRESVVWMSQEMTPQIGMEKIQQYLSDFEYGNQDMTAGLKYAWLTPAPFILEPMQNSLKISGYEQVKFLRKLWRRELKASKESQILTQKIMTHDKSPKGFELVGKTGSGFKDDVYDQRIGWFVGHLQKEESEYIVVFNFSDTKKQTPGTFGGREAKELTLKLLTEKKLW